MQASSQPLKYRMSDVDAADGGTLGASGEEQLEVDGEEKGVELIDLSDREGIRSIFTVMDKDTDKSLTCAELEEALKGMDVRSCFCDSLLALALLLLALLVFPSAVARPAFARPIGFNFCCILPSCFLHCGLSHCWLCVSRCAFILAGITLCINVISVLTLRLCSLIQLCL